MKIKVREITPGCMPEKIEVGDWIDLRVSEDSYIYGDSYWVIPLGVAMELPKGYEAIIEPRSSTIRRYGLIGITGVIDNSYCGDNDEWKFCCYATRNQWIKKGARLCQFRIQKKQPSFELVKVDHLGNKDRGGLGSTGV